MPSKMMEILEPIVDKTIAKLSDPNFRKDPIGGKFGFVTSVISSAYKRHGLILEAALRERLKEGQHLILFNEDKFFISNQAKTLAASTGKRLHDMRLVHLPYKKENMRDYLQVDLIVFNKKTKVVSSYEVKRGNGHFDAGKKRSIRQDMLTTNFLLKDWLKKEKKITASRAHSYIICYYGLRALPKPFSLIKEDLDKHFGFSVINEIEKVNNYFKTWLHKMINSKI